MFWAWDITVPAGTTESAPKEQTLKLTKGTITRMRVKFPEGCHSLVKVRILHQESQLVPLSRGEWVTGNGETVEAEVYFNLPADINTLKFVSCSPGTSYAHKITVRVDQLTEEEASTAPLTRLLYKFLQRIGVI